MASPNGVELVKVCIVYFAACQTVELKMRKRLVLLQALAILVAVFQYDTRAAGQDEGGYSNRILSNIFYPCLAARYIHVLYQVMYGDIMYPLPSPQLHEACSSSPHYTNPAFMSKSLHSETLCLHSLSGYVFQVLMLMSGWQQLVG